MSIKKQVMKKGMQMMGDPRVAKVMQNPQVMKLMGAAFQMPGKVEAFTNEQARNLANALRLATAEDVKDLQRSVKRLERELERLQTQLGRQ
jgi:hypothetical protein